VDLTQSTDDELHIKGAAAKAAQAAQGAKKGKGKERENAPVKSAPAEPAKASSFQPFRPMLFGVNVNLDEDEEEEGIDAKASTSVAAAAEESMPAPAAAATAPSLSKPKRAASPLLWEENENVAANTSVLLLPDNVHVAESGDEEDEDSALPVDMEGVHMVDDDNTRVSADLENFS
jgi:hypothetical protein